MAKKHLGLFAALALLALLLAACSGAAGTAAGTAAVPETGSTGGATTASGTTTAGTCVGVDTQALMTAGKTVYDENCAGCHGAQGEGANSFPALAGSQDLTVADVAGLVQKYFAVEGHPKTLTVQDLAGALTYVRGSFGNTGAAICPDQITIPMP